MAAKTPADRASQRRNDATKQAMDARYNGGSKASPNRTGAITAGARSKPAAKGGAGKRAR
jgi:hypothetical protein